MTTLQKPVAWIHTDPDNPRVKFLEWREEEPGYHGHWLKTPLYPDPQRKPLTYGEISKILSEYETNYDMIGFARAIEKAHGI